MGILTHMVGCVRCKFSLNSNVEFHNTPKQSTDDKIWCFVTITQLLRQKMHAAYAATIFPSWTI